MKKTIRRIVPAKAGIHFKGHPERSETKRRISSISKRFLGLWVLGMTVLISHLVYCAEPIPVELKGVGIEEHLGKPISLDVEFVDESGKTQPLKTFFDGKHPVVLLMIYYTCPNLCHYLLNGFMDSLQKMSWGNGKFNIVSVSINPRETPDVSFKRKQKLKLSNQWHFLTGKEENIEILAKEIGFQYRWDPDQKEYAHSAALFILTPEGKISRYLYGIQFNPLDIKLALLEASRGKIGNVVDKFLLFCYHYDPKGKKYALFASRLMAGGGILTIIAITFLLIFLSKRRNKGMSFPGLTGESNHLKNGSSRSRG